MPDLSDQTDSFCMNQVSFLQQTLRSEKYPPVSFTLTKTAQVKDKHSRVRDIQYMCKTPQTESVSQRHQGQNEAFTGKTPGFGKTVAL